MSKLVMRLEEVGSEHRSRQVFCRFTARNTGEARIRIESVILRPPEGATVLRFTQPSSLRRRPSAEQLCSQLERLLSMQIGLGIESDALALPRTRFSWGVRTISHVLASPVLLAVGMTRFLRDRLAAPRAGEERVGDLLRGLAAQSNGLVPELHGSDDADEAWRVYFDAELRGQAEARRAAGTQPGASNAKSTHRPIWKSWFGRHNKKSETLSPAIYRAYLTVKTQLERLQPSKLADDPGRSSPGLALVTDGEYSRDFVLSCRRGVLNTQLYPLVAEISYRVGNDDPVYDERTTTVRISPNPMVVSLFSLAGASLSSYVRQGLCMSGALDSLPADVCASPVQWWPWSVVPAALLALLFYNVIEFTTMGERFTKGSGWRGALMVGVLCGLASERILSALLAVLG